MNRIAALRGSRGKVNLGVDRTFQIYAVTYLTLIVRCSTHLDMDRASPVRLRVCAIQDKRDLALAFGSSVRVGASLDLVTQCEACNDVLASCRRRAADGGFRRGVSATLVT